MSFKYILDRVVLWIIKNHWIFLIVIIGSQYLTGKMMTGWPIPFGVSISTLLAFHKFNGGLIMTLAVLLVIEKGYLWLKRSGRI